jgi:hypothetical protein
MKGDNEAKYLHASSLVNAFATDEQKEILSSNVAPRIDAKDMRQSSFACTSCWIWK